MPNYLIAFNDEWVPPQTEDQLRSKSASSEALLEEMKSAGVFLFADGGIDASTAVCSVVSENGKPVFTDGPFVETKEHLGGFTVVNVADDEAARYWAGRLAVALDWPQEVHRFPSDMTEIVEAARVGVVTGPDVDQAITRAHLEEWARVVAGLARRFGDLDLAEDAAAEAFTTAVERWPRDGVPPNPGAWLTTTATRKAIDRLRRESRRDDKHKAAQMLSDDSPPEPTGPIDDDRLRLIFTCCHPVLAMEARVALTLRLLGGLTVAEIARAFFVTETTMARRITRAKAKIAAARVPYRVPSATDLRERLAGVLAVIYLVFNEGYLATGGDDPMRADLSDEAIRLGRLLRTLLPDEGEVTGLLALMLLIDARRTARVSRTGELVTLEEQDRGAWRRDLIVEGHALVRERIAAVAAGGEPPGRYQLLAAINAVHTDAPSARDTDWSQIVALYDRLLGADPSAVVRLNRAIAVAEIDGPDVALAELDRLRGPLDGYHAYHAARADLLRRLGRSEEARSAYDRAVQLSGNPAERAYLVRRRDQLVW